MNRLDSVFGCAFLALGFMVPFTLIMWVRANQIGPMYFWASDVCPDPAVTCGILPLVILPAALSAVPFFILASAFIFAEEPVEAGR